MPVAVEYVGYGGGRGLPSFWLVWPSAGFAAFVMDTRGQGAAWLPGATLDMDPDGFQPLVMGWFTRGIRFLDDLVIQAPGELALP